MPPRLSKAKIRAFLEAIDATGEVDIGFDAGRQNKAGHPMPFFLISRFEPQVIDTKENGRRIAAFKQRYQGPPANELVAEDWVGGYRVIELVKLVAERCEVELPDDVPAWLWSASKSAGETAEKTKEVVGLRMFSLEWHLSRRLRPKPRLSDSGSAGRRRDLLVALARILAEMLSDAPTRSSGELRERIIQVLSPFLCYYLRDLRKEQDARGVVGSEDSVTATVHGVSEDRLYGLDSLGFVGVRNLHYSRPRLSGDEDTLFFVRHWATHADAARILSDAVREAERVNPRLALGMRFHFLLGHVVMHASTLEEYSAKARRELASVLQSSSVWQEVAELLTPKGLTWLKSPLGHLVYENYDQRGVRPHVAGFFWAVIRGRLNRLDRKVQQFNRTKMGDVILDGLDPLAEQRPEEYDLAIKAVLVDLKGLLLATDSVREEIDQAAIALEESGLLDGFDALVEMQCVLDDLIGLIQDVAEQLRFYALKKDFLCKFFVCSFIKSPINNPERGDYQYETMWKRAEYDAVAALMATKFHLGKKVPEYAKVRSLFAA